MSKNCNHLIVIELVAYFYATRCLVACFMQENKFCLTLFICNYAAYLWFGQLFLLRAIDNRPYRRDMFYVGAINNRPWFFWVFSTTSVFNLFLWVTETPRQS